VANTTLLDDIQKEKRMTKKNSSELYPLSMRQVTRL